MARHRLKQKKRKAGKQWWADLCIEGAERSGRYPVSHHAEDRVDYCWSCGHPWAWHDNVWLKVDAEGKVVDKKLRCCGGYPMGLTLAACQCREEYPHQGFKVMTWRGFQLGLETQP